MRVIAEMQWLFFARRHKTSEKQVQYSGVGEPVENYIGNNIFLQSNLCSVIIK